MSTEQVVTSRDPRVRVPAWLRAHAGLVDALLAVALWLLFSASVFVIGQVDQPATGEGGSPGAVTTFSVFVVTSVQTLGLAWRRTRPDVSFGLVLAGHLGQLVVAESPLPSNVTALASAYAVAAHSTRPWVRWVALAAGAAGGVLATRDWQYYRDSTLSGQVMTSLFLSGLVLVCWLWGDLARKRRELVRQLREQNEALRRDRDQRARLAAQDERTRIAREMHDIVAHSLSVVVVQADGAAYTATHVADFDREAAGRALHTIGTTAREALEETRRLVGVLRTTEEDGDVPGGPPTGAEFSPTDSLTQLPALVERVGASGVDITLEAPADLAGVRREVGLAAYRIVQESLTNVLKHAGPRPGVTVRVLVGEAIEVSVRDDGRGAAASDDGHGHGLIGMRERAASVGGTLRAGPAPGGGFHVAATLPLRPRQESR